LRSALDGAVADGDFELATRLAVALGWYWFLRGRFAEARRSLEVLPESPAVAAWLAGFMYLQGDAGAAAVRDRCLPEVDARAEWWLAFNGSDTGDLATCLEMLEHALKNFTADGDQWGVAAVLVARAKHAHVRADLQALESDANESAAIFRSLGDRWGLLQATGWLGAHAELVGDFDEAERLHAEGLRMAEELEAWPEVAGELGWLGWTAIRRGDYAVAREYGVRGLRLATEQGHLSSKALTEIVLGFAARRTGELDEAEARLQGLVDAARRQDQPVLYLSMVLEELGYTYELRGSYAKARELHAEAFRVSQDYESGRGMCWALEGLAAALVDEPELAACLLGAAAAARAAENYMVTFAEAADIERAAARVVGFEAAYERGSALSLEEAFAEVAG
jgi:tetratricopeptide (TPR) repeat protein